MADVLRKYRYVPIGQSLVAEIVIYLIFITIMQKIAGLICFAGFMLERMFGKTLYSMVAVYAVAVMVCSLHFNPSHAQGIEQLLIENVPVPQQRPSQPAPRKEVEARNSVAFATRPEPDIRPVRGSLKEGLAALDRGRVTRALAIRKYLPAGSLDRKILAWAIAMSGKPGIPSATIANIANDLPDWPDRDTMQRNLERALTTESFSAANLIKAFPDGEPLTIEGSIVLARAYLDLGETENANRTIAPIWRGERLNRKTERRILNKAGAALTRQDHRVRMHQLLYWDRATAATRVASKAEQVSLAKARVAVVRKSKRAAGLIKAVAPSSKQDTGYLFARIEYARRTEQYSRAADLLLKAPSDPDLLIDPHEWWVERRIVSRQLLELGKPKLAYKLAATHAAQKAADVVEAEFHAGWYALRFLKDSESARKHFQNILRVAKRPISRARGYYWLARASSPADADRLYQNAARHKGTFYGQLAAVELGENALNITKTKSNPTDRANIRSRQLYQVKERLEKLGHDKRATLIYRYLARSLESPGELAILAADAERRGNHTLSLQIGKAAFGRGLEVDTLSWPLGAIPGSAKISDAGRALAYAVARQESEFNKAAISRANARGLLQLLPRTARSVARRSGLKYSKQKLTRDAAYNATLGSAYLSEQLQRFDNSYVLTFAAYNAGPSRVDEWISRFGDPRRKPLYTVIDWIEQIPFSETRSYVQRVMENYQVYKRRIANTNLGIKKDLIRGR